MSDDTFNRNLHFGFGLDEITAATGMRLAKTMLWPIAIDMNAAKVPAAAQAEFWDGVVIALLGALQANLGQSATVALIDEWRALASDAAVNDAVVEAARAAKH